LKRAPRCERLLKLSQWDRLSRWQSKLLQEGLAEYLEQRKHCQSSCHTRNPTSGKELVERFDENVAVAREKLANLDGDRLEDKWSLYRDGKFMFDMPRWKVLMGFNLAHMVHHRAQLGVYLRLNGIAVPGVYGPSQDDKDAAAK